MDDDGAPPAMPAGTRIHKDGEIDGPSSRSPTPADLEMLKARGPLPMPKPAIPKSKAPKPKAPPVWVDMVSDRRRCLELAVQSGATDPDEVLSVAGRFAAFLDPQ